LLAEADALQELGDTQGAQAALRQAIELEPKNYEPWLAYGTYLAYSWGQLEQGRAALQQALLLSGNDGSVYVVVDTLPPAP
jgi:cytochrome c-type biogenesis protein CcmH/NrfG